MGGQSSEAEGAVVNDSPVDCQSRDLTEPQRDRPPLRGGESKNVGEAISLPQ